MGTAKDYTAIFENSDKTNPDAPAAGSTVRLYLTGCGKNHTGTVTGSYRIIDPKTDINKAKAVINSGKACVYMGRAIEPGEDSNPALVITMGSGAKKKILSPGTDYEILGYYNNVAKGKAAYVLLRGKGSYTGVRAVKFAIGASAINDSFGGVFDPATGELK